MKYDHEIFDCMHDLNEFVKEKRDNNFDIGVINICTTGIKFSLFYCMRDKK